MYFFPGDALSVPVPVSAAVAAMVTGPGATGDWGRVANRNPIGVIPGGISGSGSDTGAAATAAAWTSTAATAQKSATIVQFAVVDPPGEAIVAPAVNPAPADPEPPVVLYRWVNDPAWVTVDPDPENAATMFPDVVPVNVSVGLRSEERRVGKKCRSRWWPYQ